MRPLTILTAIALLNKNNIALPNTES